MNPEHLSAQLAHLERTLRRAFEVKKRFTILEQDYIYCTRGDTLKEEGDVITQATDNGVYIFASVFKDDINSAPTGERPMRIGSSDDFIDIVKSQISRRDLGAREILEIRLDLSLQTINPNSELHTITSRQAITLSGLS